MSSSVLSTCVAAMTVTVCVSRVVTAANGPKATGCDFVFQRPGEADVLADT